MANAVPVFVDIDPDTFNIDSSKIEEAITSNTKVIMPVHISGNPADMETIIELAHKYDIKVIEDAAQAHGAEWNNTKVGALGLGGIFSFQTSKNMSAGEGGAIVSNDKDFIDKCFSYHNCGRVRNGKWYEYHRLGSNLRMSALNAAILLLQIDTLIDDFNLREKNRDRLDGAINDMHGLIPMKRIEGARSSNHIFMCRYLEEEFGGVKREVFFKAMQAEGIFTYKGWSPLYKEPLFSINPKEYPWLEGMRYKELDHNNTEKFSDKEAVWLRQNYLVGSEQDTEDIINAFEKVVSSIQKDPKNFLSLDL